MTDLVPSRILQGLSSNACKSVFVGVLSENNYRLRLKNGCVDDTACLGAAFMERYVFSLTADGVCFAAVLFIFRPMLEYRIGRLQRHRIR